MRISVILIIAWIVVVSALVRLSFSMDITLTWDANTEPDLAGYRVHWDSQPVPPFANHMTVSKQTTATLTGITGNYFAVTAFNASGMESGYSNIVSAVLPAPVNLRTVIVGGLEIK